MVQRTLVCRIAAGATGNESGCVGRAGTGGEVRGAQACPPEIPDHIQNDIVASVCSSLSW